MNSSIIPLIVAIVGVTGTLCAALLTQRSYVRTKELELKGQREQREDDRRQINLKERRDTYIALNAAARNYRRAIKNHVFEYTAQTRSDLENARQEFDRRNAEGQLIAHAAVLGAIHSVSTMLAETFGQVKRLPAPREEPLVSASDDEREVPREALLVQLNGPVAEEIRLLRKIMREDLGVTEAT